jgi:spore coat protein U-like protein
MKRSLRIPVALLSLFAAVSVLAATATATLSVTSSVTATCVIGTAPLAFPAYNTVTAVQVDGTGTVTVTCTNTAPYTIGLDNGANFAAGSRGMAGPGGSRLNYAVFQDAGRTTAWGAGASALAGAGTGAAQALTVYGRIAAGQTSAQPGAYADSVVATVNF